MKKNLGELFGCFCLIFLVCVPLALVVKACLAHEGESFTLREILFYAAIVFMSLLTFAFISLFLLFVRLWMRAHYAGCTFKARDFVRSFCLKINARVVVDILISAHKAGMPIDMNNFHAYYVTSRGFGLPIKAIIAASNPKGQLVIDNTPDLRLAFDNMDTTASVMVTKRTCVIHVSPLSAGFPSL